MPCRREEEDEDDEAAAAGEEEKDAEGEGEEEESFLLLQQSVTVGGSGDVDRLVAQIGEALQLDAAHGSRPAPRGPLALKQQSPPPPPPPPPLRPPVLQLLLPPGPASAALQPSGPLQCAGSGARAALSWASAVGTSSQPPPRAPSGPCAPGGAPARSSACGPHVCKRGFPQPLPGPCRRAWLRGAAASRRLQQQQHQHHQYRNRGQPGLRAGEDDPHQFLQQLVLSGNLIKEAVRRLHSRHPRQHFRARDRLPPVPVPPLPLPLAVQEAEAEGTLALCSPRRPACSNPEGLRSQLVYRLGDGILVPSS